MKNQKSKTTKKFSLEKFEVAKLNNMKTVKGGFGVECSNIDVKTTDPISKGR